MPSADPNAGLGDGDGLGLYNKTKKRKFGVYDSYRHCKNGRNSKIQPPPPDSVGLTGENDPRNLADPDAPDCDDDEMTPPEDDEDDETQQRNLGGSLNGDTNSGEWVDTNRVVVTCVYISDIEPTIRIQVPINSEIAKGVDLFDAVRLASGRPHPYMEGAFNSSIPIDHYTPLKPLNLQDGDVVEVRDLDRPLPDGYMREWEVKAPAEIRFDDNPDSMSAAENSTVPEEDVENLVPTPESPEEFIPEHAWEQPGDVGYEVYQESVTKHYADERETAKKKAAKKADLSRKLRG
jgi:hypothetical protein